MTAYYEWYEYHSYSADDYYVETDPDGYTYWLHSVATIRYKYREDNYGRIRLISTTWYKLEHTMQMKPNDGQWWLSCNGVVNMFILRGTTELWSNTGSWASHVISYPGIAFQSGDKFIDESTSGVYGTLSNTIIIY
ncbi:MAG: hypothetical protein ACFFEJ_02635 [Candidatus Thorarchaeota archaeon]